MRKYVHVLPVCGILILLKHPVHRHLNWLPGERFIWSPILLVQRSISFLFFCLIELPTSDEYIPIHPFLFELRISSASRMSETRLISTIAICPKFNCKTMHRVFNFNWKSLSFFLLNGFTPLFSIRRRIVLCLIAFRDFPSRNNFFFLRSNK